MTNASDSGLSHDHFIRLLMDQYGRAGDLTRLPGENLNFLVETADARYVLKVAAMDRTDEIIDMEHLAVEHLVRSGVGMELPRTIPTLAGKVVARLGINDETSLRAQLLEWVGGTAWCDLTRHGDDLLADLGRKLALVDRALAGFEHAAMYRTHQWDLTRVDQHRGSMSLTKDSRKHSMLEKIFESWTTSAKPYLGDLPKSYIHSDVNDENILVADDQVAGLLDFGDGLYNPVVCELAITLAYAMLDSDAPLEVAQKIVTSYEEVRRLNETEVRVLFPLVHGRLATTVSVAAARRAMDPDHPNWFVTEGRAWRLIEQILETNPGTAARMLIAGHTSGTR